MALGDFWEGDIRGEVELAARQAGEGSECQGLGPWGPGALGGPVKGKWTRATSCWLHGPRTPAVSTARCAVDTSRAGRRARAPGCEVGGRRRVLSLLLCTDLLRREDLIGVGCQEILPQTEFSETPA